ncbi:hypothetical protein PHYBLDRAFT_170009 [Phycomyces blakesleeanus NRRL 1555(-)]|uniref:Uncharacterized protein n=1 Tax=Phycomyces blakesleeanus (strain ATCC 8743b / DSM 1359 / FGSC 10004 / NBRC 33097 / NRRL 1555) TaxID=763407 RepID=A0A162X2A2_PHYB8|nr:hypothetical protein PHYBLDRAFT_170009 [Phycomyces blakesleeanus NRRL 1555(-)]OAD72115.1 hypothetical protein PHYBLDRAFT_170009 [Phycomyces blakesleeanus NRRL 1555(-)]|eukprot:XP_018290155.1 hypothetical protein PHYBLDRAFT_170009 [Phycomyces blakesleeanus NRRL 1555(-)]
MLFGRTYNVIIDFFSINYSRGLTKHEFQVRNLSLSAYHFPVFRVRFPRDKHKILLLCLQAPNSRSFKSYSLYLSNLIMEYCRIRKTNLVYSISSPGFRFDNKEIIINPICTISIASHAEDHNEFLS